MKNAASLCTKSIIQLKEIATVDCILSNFIANFRLEFKIRHTLPGWDRNWDLIYAVRKT
jgi:hypothetical protein